LFKEVYSYTNYFMLPIITGSEKPYEAAETGNVEEIITIARAVTSLSASGRRRIDEASRTS
jgi:hypothetical protein